MGAAVGDVVEVEAPRGSWKATVRRDPARVSLHDRLPELTAREVARFEAEHPRSRELAAARATHLLAGVPMHWMTKWPGGFPVYVAEASGSRFVDVDGHEYVDFCLGDTGSMTGHAPGPTLRAIAEQAARGITLMLPTRGRALGGAGAGAPVRRPVLAVRAHRDGREPLRRSGSPATSRAGRRSSSSTGATTAPSTRRSPRSRTGAVVARRGNLGRPVPPSETTRVVEWNDVDGLERGARARRRRLRPRGARADEHRHRPR